MFMKLGYFFYFINIKELKWCVYVIDIKNEVESKLINVRLFSYKIKVGMNNWLFVWVLCVGVFIYVNEDI